jgi:UDP-glucose 4-epimerase
MKFYSNKNVLITGGASFIGSHLSELLLSYGANVTVIDNLSSGTVENLNNSINHLKLIENDVRDSSKTKKYYKNIDVVFNLAAQHGGRGFIETHPVECLNNMLLDNIVFDNCIENNISHIVHASSACVYPINLQATEDQRNYLKETDANFDIPGDAFPDGAYGWAKLMGELQLSNYVKQYGLSGTSARIFTAYGERENESHAVIALIAKAVLKLDPYPVWGNGQQTRNFTYVEDTVKGLAFCGSREESNSYEVFNIGSSKHETVEELYKNIFKILNWKPKNIDFQLDKPVGVKSRASENSKIINKFSWEPNISLSSGLENTIGWYLSNLKNRDLNKLEDLLMER